MKAYELISDRRRFRQGSLYFPWPASEATQWDALGAIFHCYPNGKHNQPISKEDPRTPCQKARELAREKYDCTLGRLDWEEALDVLRTADV